MCRRVIQRVSPPHNVRNTQTDDKRKKLFFTFSYFNLSPIRIEGRFNNFYKDMAEYTRKISILIGKVLPLLSKEENTIFSDNQKMNAMHIHKIRNKSDIIKTIMKEYRYPESVINEIMEGEEIYQFEMPYENGALRIVFQRIEELINFLFIDANHHIYFDADKVEQNGSLFFDSCPVYLSDGCDRMDYLHTCFAFEFLDEEKIKETYGYRYSPEEQQ